MKEPYGNILAYIFEEYIYPYTRNIDRACIKKCWTDAAVHAYIHESVKRCMNMGMFDIGLSMTQLL